MAKRTGRGPEGAQPITPARSWWAEFEDLEPNVGGTLRGGPTCRPNQDLQHGLGAGRESKPNLLSEVPGRMYSCVGNSSPAETHQPPSPAPVQGGCRELFSTQGRASVPTTTAPHAPPPVPAFARLVIACSTTIGWHTATSGSKQFAALKRRQVPRPSEATRALSTSCCWFGA